MSNGIRYIVIKDQNNEYKTLSLDDFSLEEIKEAGKIVYGADESEPCGKYTERAIERDKKEKINQIYIKQSRRKCSMSGFKCIDIYDKDGNKLIGPDCDI